MKEAREKVFTYGSILYRAMISSDMQININQ